MVKYAGGERFGPLETGVEPTYCDLEERLCREREAGDSGYGNGVESLGGWVYDAR